MLYRRGGAPPVTHGKGIEPLIYLAFDQLRLFASRLRRPIG
jgi:hypothetical protein